MTQPFPLPSASGRPLVYAHLGDLPITNTKARNYLALLAMLAQLEVECRSQFDFICLPGNVADNGRPEQYRLVATALRLVSAPVCALAGDHDMEPGSRANFYARLGDGPRLPLHLGAHSVWQAEAAWRGAWEENGILGTQPGPNRNAKPTQNPSSTNS